MHKRRTRVSHFSSTLNIQHKHSVYTAHTLPLYHAMRLRSRCIFGVSDHVSLHLFRKRIFFICPYETRYTLKGCKSLFLLILRSEGNECYFWWPSRVYVFQKSTMKHENIKYAHHTMTSCAVLLYFIHGFHPWDRKLRLIEEPLLVHEFLNELTCFVISD